MKINFSKNFITLFNKNKAKEADFQNNCAANFSSNPFNNYLFTKANLNIAFQGGATKQIPIYAVDRERNYFRFDNAVEASKALSISRATISEQINGKSKTKGNYVFIKASEFELKDENGNTILDENGKPKINEEVLDKLLEKFIPLKTEKVKNTKSRTTAVYSVDEQGEYRKFESQAIATKEYSLAKGAISDCLRSNSPIAGNHAFIRASDFELRDKEGNLIYDEKGNIQIDKKLLNKLLDKFEERYKAPIYAIDEKGNYEKFMTAPLAEKELSVPRRNIIANSNKTTGTTGGYVFVKASIFELKDKNGNVLKDENGKIQIDKAILAEALERFKPKERAIYSIDPKRNLTRFPGKADAASETGVSLRSIRRSLNSNPPVTKSLIFIYADILELKDENGKTALDEKGNPKINEDLVNTLLQNFENKAIYAITANKKITRFDTRQDAIKELGVTDYGISDCLSGKLVSTGGCAFIAAKDVESIDKNGKIKVDQEMLDNFALDFSSLDRACYVIYKDGRRERYDNPISAAEALKVSYSTIYAHLRDERKTFKDYMVVFAQDIEKYDENNNPVVDTNKIEKLMDKFKSQFRIYAINAQGECIEFNSIRHASRIIGASRRSIQLSTQGVYKTYYGYVLVKADEIETTDETGKITIDKAKLAEFLKVFEDKSIYAVEEYGKYKKYASQTEASNTLNIPLNAISACTTGKRHSAKGISFVATTDIVIGKDKDGNDIVDSSVLKEIVDIFHKNEIYSIDQYGNCQKFNTIQEASKALKLDAKRISANSYRTRDFASGITFVRANELEIRDNEGVTGLNKAVIVKAMRRLQKRAIYVVSPYGRCQRFDSIAQAVRDKYGMYFDPTESATFCKQGYSIFRASAVEKISDDGKISVNRGKMHWIVEQIQKRAIYIYNNRSKALDRYSNMQQAIRMSHAYTFNKNEEIYELKNNFHIIKAPEIESKNEYGKYSYDSKKAQKRLSKIAA